MLFLNKDSFTSFFLIWMPDISSSCLITAQTSSILLDGSGESEQSSSYCS